MRNLLGRLIERSPQSLSSVAQFWEVPLQGIDPHREAGQLYPVLTDAWSLALAWERISPREQQVLGTLVKAPRPLDLESLAAALGLDAHAVLPSLRRLYRIGLIATERSQEPDDPKLHFYVPTEIAHTLSRLDHERSHPPTGDEPLAWFLERLEDVELLELAEHLGMTVLPAVTQRQEALRFAVQRLQDRRWLAEKLDALSPSAARLWGWLNTKSRPAPAGEAQSETGTSFGEYRRAVRELAQLGVLWRGYDAQGRLLLLVPSALRQPAQPQSRPLPALATSEAVTTSPLAYPWAIAWDLLTVLRALIVAGGRWRPDEELPPTAVLRRVDGRLWIGRPGQAPPAYFALLGALAVGLGLIDGDGAPAPRERIRSWLRFPFPEQGRRLLRAWRRLPGWPEGHHEALITGLGIDWPALRARLLTGLRELRSEQWYVLETVVTRLSAQMASSGRSPFSEHPRAAWTDRDRAEALEQVIAATLGSAGRWLGIVEYGRDADGAVVVRLTDAGAWLLGLHGAPPSPHRTGPAIAADEDGWIAVIHPSPALVWALSAFADLAELGPPARYRVTRSSLLRALRSGLQLSQILRYLEAQLGEPPPGELAQRLQRWMTEHRPAWLAHALVVRAAEPDQLEQAREKLAQAGFMVELVASERLLVELPERAQPDAVLRRIRQLLREAGLSPEWRARPGL
ncbi:helicase-associated domain-containing protein [Thermomicrobiaceae bacterium CFH 74404]|uniref:Helicase-associated domain-containing protein n=1 Tax=Thermalbibacter longus TaxID=2951981 RepID=A0AA41WFC2_9BACT|nr:helicase-associated domain-containing protein [Thermalbibacter longus]MCM8748371.1 helicase-associated domain-containing protein [Thermalbibacter longus]